MLNTSLSWFNKSIDNLKKYIEMSIKQKQDLVDLLKETNLIQSNTKLQKIIKNYDNIESLKKNIDYSAIVILLYGALERYIENVAKEYLQSLSELVSQYNDLPNKIKDNHLQKSIDLLNNLKIDKYQDINQNDIINNLYYCQSSNLSYKLNTDSYTQHTANFRYNTINQFFGELGIENTNQKIIENEKFKTYLSSSGLFTEKLESINKGQYGIILSVIDQLVQIRNQISHGQPTDELIELELFKDNYINFIEQYVFALQEILLQELLPFEVKKNGINLGEAIKIIDNSIVCIEVNNLNIKIGDRIVSYNSNNKTYDQGKILSIQINNQEVNSVSREEFPQQVGMKVDFKIKNNRKFYLISAVQ